MSSPSHRFAERLVRWRGLLLLVGVVLAVLSLVAGGPVEYDRSIENMFAPDDPLLEPYRKLQQLFGGNEIVLAVYQDPQLLSAEGEGIRRLEKVSRELKGIPGVRDVLSLAQLSEALERLELLGQLFAPAGRDVPAIIDPDMELADDFRQLFAGYTHGFDGRTAALVCMLEPESHSATSRQATIEQLRASLQTLPRDMQPALLAGEPVMLVDGFQFVQADGERLGWATTLLLALTIVLCFRSLRWVLIPILVVQLSLVLTHLFLSWANLRLSMVSSMLTAIVTVVGVATVVHIIVRFRDARAAGESTRTALTSAAIILAAPIFWACTTDAAGFASLLASRVGPVQDFGVMMAIGALMVIVSVVLLVPALALAGKWDVDPRRAWGERLLESQLGGAVHWIDRYPRALGLGLLFIAFTFSAGALFLEVETDFTKNFRQGSRIVRAYAFVETHMGGAGAWDVLLPAPRTIDNAYLDRVLELEERLRSLRLPGPQDASPALTKVISLADADAIARQKSLVALLPAEQRLQAMQLAMPTFYDALRSREPDEQGHSYFRIMLRSPERQPAEQKQWTIREVERLAREAFPATEGNGPVHVTGFFVLLTNLIDSMLADQWRCFAVAITAIAIMMWIAFRSLPLALIALVPNVVPIFMVMGLLGWLGLKINMGTAMIAAVSMGLSIDSSIHYITSFQRARGSGQSILASIQQVQQSVGRALVFATLALVMGFLVLCTSQFIPTVYFGVLVSLAMLGGLTGNLVMLPLLLRLLVKEE